MKEVLIILMIYVSDGGQRNHFIFKNDSIAFYDTFKKINVVYPIIKKHRLYSIYECDTVVVRVTKRSVYLFDGEHAKKFKIIKRWELKVPDST